MAERYTAIPSIKDLIDGFSKKPYDYKISNIPTRTEIKKLRKAVYTNLSLIPCVIATTITVNCGWAWMIQSDNDWTEMHADHQSHNPPPIAPPSPGGTLAPPVFPASLPARPTTPNPGTFEITSTWSKKEQARQEEFYIKISISVNIKST